MTGFAAARQGRVQSRMPTIPVEIATLAASLFIVAAYNRSFLALFLEGRNWTESYTWVAALSAIVLLIALHFLLLLLVANRWTLKPLFTLLIAVSPAAAYFSDRYGVIFTTDMMRNVVETDVKEAGELLTTRLAVQILVFGLLPIAAIWMLRFPSRPLAHAFTHRVKWIAATLVVVVAMGAPFSKDFFSTVRNHKQLGHMLVPISVLVGGTKAVTSAGAMALQPRIQIGLDATAPAAKDEGRKPRLLVFVVGETARAANWGLNGYARQTTPELADLGVLNFPEVSSCGTATEVSLPCLFSTFGRRNYDEDEIRSHESLLHVLDHAGVSVLWRDNQSGCKGVCDGLPTVQVQGTEDPSLCNGERCFDEILISDLNKVVDETSGDMVVFLHQLGNHGPSYFQRYPDAFRRFVPTCDTAELGNCSVEAVVNSYDNALAYTDHMVAETIRLLQKREDRDVGLIYVSDHGESLGEYGLYLHGMPYAIAPSVQTHVPMVMWFSDGFAAGRSLDLACLADVAKNPTDHDALFHTVLGLMDVSTDLYEPEWDLTSACRPGRSLAAGRGRSAPATGPASG